MAHLRILKVRYRGRHWRYDSPDLEHGLNVLVGPNGAGKTTFADIVYFALGGTVRQFERTSKGAHKEIMQDENNFVELKIGIDEEVFVLQRYFGTNDIAIKRQFGETNVDVYPVNRTKGESKTFSDWLLEKLGIEAVTLRQGTKQWKLNFNDIARLLYHNQSPDPVHVFRPPDINNFITDSGYVRKTIFEILTGHSHQELHHVYAGVLRLEEERRTIAAKIDSFDSAMSLTRGHSGVINLEHLSRDLFQFQEQLDRVASTIAEISDADETADDFLEEINTLRESIQPLERERIHNMRLQRSILNEMADLQQTHRSLLVEVTQLKKILFADDKLGLFNPDTCPYCLSEIQRGRNECICGLPIAEGQYRRFFYSPKEYLTILKSRQKNIETLDQTLEDLSIQADALDRREKELSQQVEAQQHELHETLSRRRSTRAIPRKLSELEEKKAETLVQISGIKRAIELEAKRQHLENEKARITEELEHMRTTLKSLEAAAERDLQGTKSSFNRKYSELMRATVENCRSAYLSEDYDPIINDGEYLEASARVPVRLMFFTVLMYLSLRDPDVTFPRFLLIDTPQTAGVDRDRLHLSIATLVKECSVFPTHHWQIILTTGPGTYPESLESSVLQHLTKAERLLIPVPETSS